MLLFGGLKRPWNTGIILPATWELHVDNKTPPAIRRFFRLDSWFGKGSKIRLETLKPLENAGLFRLVEIIPQGHTFATTALEHGMDIKTLSAIVGHISSATTIDIYSHITDTMQVRAANRVEQGLGRGEAFVPREDAEGEVPAKPEIPPERARFEPYRGKNRKSGTGGIYEINDHLFEGRYTPTNAQGKREVHTVYAKTREEVEPLLEQMIAEVRAKIKEEKRKMKETAGGSPSASV